MPSPSRKAKRNASAPATDTTDSITEGSTNQYWLDARAYGAIYSASWKPPCRAATTANISLTGEQTIDDIALIEGDYCLVKNQNDLTENGMYTVSPGTWDRNVAMDALFDVQLGAYVHVRNGTKNGSKLFKMYTTVDFVAFGTTEIYFHEVTYNAAFYDMPFVTDLGTKTLGGVRRTTPEAVGFDFTIQPEGATSASTNKAGGGLVLTDGQSTGSATGGGILLKAFTAGSSGTADQSLKTLAQLKNNFINFYTNAHLAAGTNTTNIPALELTQTWNNGAVAFQGIKLNVTDTSSDAASVLFELQVAAARKFAVGKAGGIGVFGTTPPTTRQTYTVTNGTLDRTYNANATTTDELADILFSLLTDLAASGHIILV